VRGVFASASSAPAYGYDAYGKCHSASKTRVNAVMALHRIRETRPNLAPMGSSPGQALPRKRESGGACHRHRYMPLDIRPQYSYVPRISFIEGRHR